MNVKAQLKGYEGLEFSITLTAPVEDWRTMLKHLGALKDCGYYAWPVGGFVASIESMLTNLDKTHFDVLRREDQAKGA